MIGVALALLSGCGASTESPVPAAPDTAVETTPPAPTPTVSDTESHTLSVELMTYQGGTEGARQYVVIQAKQACDSINKAVYIEDLISETTWRGGMAQVRFICVDKDDPRLKEQ